MELHYADEFDTIDAAFPWIFGTFIAIFVCAVVLVAVITVRNRRVFRQAGLDPTTAGAQLAVRLLRGQSAARPVPSASASASASASDRLVELTDLRDRGLITPQEYQARREQIINGI